MEWVETTGKTLEEARERILDQLGVAEEDVEIEVLEQPKSGLFGLIRGEARVRGRVRPAEVRPKQDRRRGRGRGGRSDSASTEAAAEEAPAPRSRSSRGRAEQANSSNGRTAKMNQDVNGRQAASVEADEAEAVDPEEVGRAAAAFISGLVEAFGRTATVQVAREGEEIEVRADGQDLGLLVGPGGRTLLALQDLTRVVAQRRLGDHVTRLRVDVAGYRERRQKALEKFVAGVAADVVATGEARSLEAMPSADRKIVHDVLTGIEGVSSRSEGEDPYRRVVIVPA